MMHYEFHREDQPGNNMYFCMKRFNCSIEVLQRTIQYNFWHESSALTLDFVYDIIILHNTHVLMALHCSIVQAYSKPL